MRNLDEIDVQEILDYIQKIYCKTTKKQRILFVVIVLLSVSGYFYGKNICEIYSILKQAKNIISEISKSENNYLKQNGKYKQDIFTDSRLANLIKIGSGNDESFDYGSSNRSRRRRSDFNTNNDEEDANIAQSGNFYIEVDAENACMMLKYKRNTSDKTIYYASFKDPKVLCKGKKCLKQAKNEGESLCYANSSCFPSKLILENKQACGDGHGVKTRTCEPSCRGGVCGEWSECLCKKGFEWDGKTCKQSQTEKDCTDEQCFNGIYCEDKEILSKNIENGTCQRFAECKKNKGWQYTSWNCSCNDKNFCASKETCVAYPVNKTQITLPNGEGLCTGIYYECKDGEGWVEKAKNCECNKTGFFWDIEKKETKCSSCTKKPEGAIFTSSGQNKDDCAWKCEEGYKNRNGVCAKPDGQYLCARMDLQICTDDFSRKRKIQKDAKRTNEKQPCFVEDKDNILFYNQKEKSCILCQCLDLISKSK